MSKFILPEDVLKQHLVALGKTGSGKSSALRYIVEHLLDQKKRVCVLDPKGDWWGIKVAADGKGPGFPVVLFGDFKNASATDVPINERSGKQIAELVSDGNRPCVIGLGGWHQSSMTNFWIDFASTLFAKNAGELYLVGDEFHNFAPKGKVLSPQAGMSLHWSNRLLSEGRGLGIVCLLASQRPQKVHNDTLTSCETLVGLRVVHAADRSAYKDWIDGNGDPEVGKQVLTSLAGLEKGEAWVWSPDVKFGPERLKFPMFKTFDSFAPPQLQKRVSNKGWADVDLGAVKEKLAAVIKEHEANDPKTLKAEVIRLRADLAKAGKGTPAAEVKTKTVEKAVVTDAQIARLEKLYERAESRIQPAVTKIADTINPLLALLHDERAEIGNLLAAARAVMSIPKAAPVIPQRPVSIPRTPVNIPPKREKLHEAAEDSNGDLRISKTQQRILDALAWYESLGTAEPSLTQIGAVALIDPTGGHFSNTVGPLSSAGLIERGNGSMRLTDDGRALAKVPESATSIDEYHDVLRARVRKMKSAGGKTIEMLDVIIGAGGEALTAEAIGQAVGIDHTGGHFSNMIGPLGTAGLIERRAGTVTPTDVLFPAALMAAV